jgi:hypothetical protein
MMPRHLDVTQVNKQTQLLGDTPFFPTFFCRHFLISFLFIPFLPLFPSFLSIYLSHSLQHLYVQSPFLSPFFPPSPLQCNSSENFPQNVPSDECININIQGDKKVSVCI